MPVTNGESNGIDGHQSDPLDVDVLVIGAGFGGCYSLWKFRKLGYRTHLFEAGTGLGGVWHWNKYPGARVDSEIPYYQFSILEVWKTWNWSQRFPGHEELRAYFEHVDKVLNLSKDVSYGTNLVGADFDEDSGRWTVVTENGKQATCKYLICATGSSYKRHYPDWPGLGDYKGQLIHSAFWPENETLTDKRVAIIGAGATGIQCVQSVSKQAKKMTVYIRTPNIALPMGQRDLGIQEQNINKAIYASLFKLAKNTAIGLACDNTNCGTFDASEKERLELWDELWSRGGFNFQAANYRDFVVDQKANDMLYEYWASRTRPRVKNLKKREIICPQKPPYAFATKRSSLEQDYYECLDYDHVDIVDLKTNGIQRFTEHGIETCDGKTETFDAIVLATGYDNMTGSLTSMGLRGKDGVDIKERWKEGVWTYLGIMTSGCPNMLMIYGPQAPTAFTNGPVFIEMQVDLVADFVEKLTSEGIKSIEPRHSAEKNWKQTIQDMSDATLFPLTDSWYMGANIPGKKREQLNYIGGVDRYGKEVEEALKDWSAFDIIQEKPYQGMKDIPVVR